MGHFSQPLRIRLQSWGAVGDPIWRAAGEPALSCTTLSDGAQRQWLQDLGFRQATAGRVQPKLGLRPEGKACSCPAQVALNPDPRGRGPAREAAWPLPPESSGRGAALRKRSSLKPRSWLRAGPFVPLCQENFQPNLRAAGAVLCSELCLLCVVFTPWTSELTRRGGAGRRPPGVWLQAIFRVSRVKGLHGTSPRPGPAGRDLHPPC